MEGIKDKLTSVEATTRNKMDGDVQNIEFTDEKTGLTPEEEIQKALENIQ